LENHVVQATRLGILTQPLRIAAPSDEQKANIPPITQTLSQIKQDVHPLRHAHVAGIHKNGAPSQRAISH
jgi:hypothetical protein